jgi:MFS superfamily sulfate permease-like transporter
MVEYIVQTSARTHLLTTCSSPFQYIIVWATFIAIQLVGMDAGIVIGVLVAIVDHVIHSAKALVVTRVNKKSRAVWSPEEYRILQNQGYDPHQPKIVTVGEY